MATNILVNSFPATVAPKYRMALRGLSGGVLATVPVSAAGTGFTSVPTVAVTGGTFVTVAGGPGQHAVITANLAPAGVNATITVTLGGSGYKFVPSVRFISVDGNGSGATATAVLTAGVVTSITLGVAGSGYTQPPLVVIDGGENSRRAEATALLAATSVTSLTIQDVGIGYSGAPTVTISGGGGSGATVTTPTITAQATLNTVLIDYLGNDWWAFTIGGRYIRWDGRRGGVNAALKLAFTGTGGLLATDKVFGTTV